MKKHIGGTLNKFALILSLLLANRAFASSYNIGSGGGSEFQPITSLMQDWVDFMTGPWGKTVVVGSLVIGATIWAVMPKAEGILGYAVRGLIAGGVVLHIAAWMGAFGG